MSNAAIHKKLSPFTTISVNFFTYLTVKFYTVSNTTSISPWWTVQ